MNRQGFSGEVSAQAYESVKELNFLYIGHESLPLSYIVVEAILKYPKQGGLPDAVLRVLGK